MTGPACVVLVHALGRDMTEIQPQIAGVCVRFDEERLAGHEHDILGQRPIEQRSRVKRLLSVNQKNSPPCGNSQVARSLKCSVSAACMASRRTR